MYVLLSIYNFVVLSFKHIFFSLSCIRTYLFWSITPAAQVIKSRKGSGKLGLLAVKVRIS